jgi:integrase
MARTVRDSNLATRSARLRLAHGQIHWRPIDRELHIGYRRGKKAGRWLIRYYKGAGHYQHDTMATADDIQDADGGSVLDFAQAQAAARKLYANLKSTSGALRSIGPYTVKHALDEYHAEQERLGKKSFAQTRKRAAAVIEPVFGSTLVERLNSDEIKRWLDDLAHTPPGRRIKKGQTRKKVLIKAPVDAEFMRRRRATANRTLSILRAALNFAWREGRVASDLAWRRVKPYRETSGARTRFLTVGEANSLVQNCGPELEILVKAGLLTGARYGELAAANVADFDPSKETLYIHQSKSGKSRYITLSEEGVPFFCGITKGRAPDQPLITRADGSRWGKNHQSRPFAEAIKKAGLAYMTFHGLRHTYASLAIMNNCPLIVVSTNLGHSDTRMCEKHYGHLANDYMRKTTRDTAPRFGFSPAPQEGGRVEDARVIDTKIDDGRTAPSSQFG